MSFKAENCVQRKRNFERNDNDNENKETVNSRHEQLWFIFNRIFKMYSYRSILSSLILEKVNVNIININNTLMKY